jgi:hypothetical protein
MDGETCGLHLVGLGTNLPFGGLGLQQFGHPVFGLHGVQAHLGQQFGPLAGHAVQLELLHAQRQVRRRHDPSRRAS